jgi:hypothetical protein
MIRRVLYAAVAAVILGASGLMASPAAQAYGGGASHDMGQVGLSFNCNNPDVCGSEDLGGFWGWVEFDRAGTTTWGDAKLSGCGHTLGGGGGAVSISIEIESWTIASGSAGPQTFYASGEETDRFQGGAETFDIVNEDTGIPAVPGHYSTADVLGFTSPGVAAQIQVAYRAAK